MPVVLKNNASNSLAAAITSTDTGVVVRNGNLFPALTAGQYFYATLTGADGSQEIVKVTARSGNGMTIVRAQEGTFALPFQLDSRFEMRITAATIADILAEDDLAATVTIADAGGYYTGGTVETALQEVGAILTTVPVARGGTGATTADNALVSLAAQKKFAQVRKDVATLLADTTITYTAGTVNSVTTGDVVQTAAEGFSYSVAASGASDHDVTTAGGVKLYVLPNEDGYSVKAFGAKGDGTTNDTAAIQKAINTNKNIVFPEGVYVAVGLTQTANQQHFQAVGSVALIKNANGVILTSSGGYVELNGLQFSGTGYTGDNINSTGSNPRFINCASSGTPGRALKATGGHVQIIGTNGTYATTDATSNGYDIEIGVSGTATLYHQLVGVYTGQPTGGILLTDTGSHVISGGQFGKLTIKAGTTPAGANGGMTTNARILGDVLVEISNATFTGNQFSTQTITFAAGTSACTLDASNLNGTATIVNNGNGNSVIVKNIGTGSPPGLRLRYGHDALGSEVRYNGTEVYYENSHLNLANGKAFRIADAAGTYRNAITINASDDWTVGADTGANFMNIVSGSVGIFMGPSGTSVYNFYSGGARPATDNAVDHGTTTQRVRATYSREIRPGAGAVIWTSGAGTPEGSITAPVGSLYTRTDGGVLTTLYVKESGTGNTGWVGK